MWRNIVTYLYPDALKRTYTVPPVHFNRVPYVRDTVPGTGQPALVLKPPYSAAGGAHVHTAPRRSPRLSPAQYSLWTAESQPLSTPARAQESDLRDDLAQRHILANLQELGTRGGEVMFVLSQLSFSSYISRPCYAAAAARLPRPVHLAPQYRDGEFDVLLIHRRYGVLIGELKAVGRPVPGVTKTQAQADADVAKRVEKAVKQLDKSETVVRHLVSDLAPGLSVRKTLFLPYVSSAQFLRVLAANPHLEQAVCQSVGAANAAEATKLCCCSNQLSDSAKYWHVTPAVLSQLRAWWKGRMACSVDPLLTDNLYLDIMTRFVGPATTVNVHCNIPPRVEVRTDAEAVAELGRRLAYLVLTLQQLDLMQRAPPRVCVIGPPGTGKTVVLILMGLRWLLQGHDVHLVSVKASSLAACLMIQNQLTMTLSADPSAIHASCGRVHLHQYDFSTKEKDVAKAVKDLSAARRGPLLHVLMDEAAFTEKTLGARLQKLIDQLLQRAPDLHFWATQICDLVVPKQLKTETLTVPLRCAPTVLRELQPGLDRTPGNILPYSDGGVAAPGDGLKVVKLRHEGHGHTDRWPVDCFKCGKAVGTRLRRLGVGAANSGGNVTNSPPPLQYRDVFILTRSSKLKDDVTDDAGNVTSPASGFVQGLRRAGFPVCVMGETDDKVAWDRDLADLAVARTDRVTVSYVGPTMGLERKVVVWLAGFAGAFDRNLSEEQVDTQDRLNVVSRCTTQLMIVDVPPGTLEQQPCVLS